MATEISRTFALDHGAVFVELQDELGNVTKHTYYVVNGLDVEAAIAADKAARDEYAAKVKAAFTAAGWKNGNQTS